VKQRKLVARTVLGVVILAIDHEFGEDGLYPEIVDLLASFLFAALSHIIGEKEID